VLAVVPLNELLSSHGAATYPDCLIVFINQLTTFLCIFYAAYCYNAGQYATSHCNLSTAAILVSL